MQQINDLFIILATSSQKYIVNGIQSVSNQKVFSDEMEKITALVYQYPDLLKLKELLWKGKQYTLTEEKFPYSFTTSHQKYKLLAYDNGLDIINSLYRRFVTGGESEYYSLGKVL